MHHRLHLFATAVAWLTLGNPSFAAEPAATASPFPRPLDSYNDAHLQGILDAVALKSPCAGCR